MSPLPTELWTSNCGAVVVVVVGADVVVVEVGDTGGGESVIFKNPVPEKNCFQSQNICQSTHPSGTCRQNPQHGTSRKR